MTIERVMITTDDPKTIEPVEKSPRGRSSDFPICPLVPLSCSRCRRRRSLSTVWAIDIDLFKLYARIDRSHKHRHVKLINDRLTRLHPLQLCQWTYGFWSHSDDLSVMHTSVNHAQMISSIFLGVKVHRCFASTDFSSTF